jgi:hypothetical protein
MSVSGDTKVSNTPFAQMKAMLRGVSAPKQMVGRESIIANDSRKPFSKEVSAESQSSRKISSADSNEMDSSHDSKTQSQVVDNSKQGPLLLDVNLPEELVTQDMDYPIDVVGENDASMVVLASLGAPETSIKTEDSVEIIATKVKSVDSLDELNQGQMLTLNKATEADVDLGVKKQTVDRQSGDKIVAQAIRDAQLQQEVQAEAILTSESSQLLNEKKNLQNAEKTLSEKPQDAVVIDAAKSGQIRSAKHDSGGLRVAAETHELMDQKLDLLMKDSIQVLEQKPAEGRQDRQLKQELESSLNEDNYRNKSDQDLAPENIIAMKFAMPLNQKTEVKPVLQATVYQSKQMNPILQVADGIHHVVKQGQQNRLHVQLLPETLGGVDIIVDMAETGKLSILVQAEKSSTYDLLRLDSANMHQTLVNAGLDVGLQDLEFSYMNSSEQNQSSGHNGTNRRHSNSDDAFEIQGPLLDEPLIHVDPNFIRIRA